MPLTLMPSGGYMDKPLVISLVYLDGLPNTTIVERPMGSLP